MTLKRSQDCKWNQTNLVPLNFKDYTYICTKRGIHVKKKLRVYKIKVQVLPM